MIPLFPLPSRPATQVQFRMPTVQDAINFSGLRDELDEAATTDYLRALLQDGAPDPIGWTAGDRVTAMWWIWMAISDDTTLAYKYQCRHCGETHHVDIDLVDLDDNLTVLEREPAIAGEIMANGQIHACQFVPLDGYAMTALEQMRLELLDATSKADKDTIKNRLKVLEVAHSFRLDAHAELPREEADAKRMELVMSMNPAKEFRVLAAQCYQALAELRHGLAMEITDGRVELISPLLPCEAPQEGEGQPPASVLLLRFQPVHCIPAI